MLCILSFSYAELVEKHTFLSTRDPVFPGLVLNCWQSNPSYSRPVSHIPGTWWAYSLPQCESSVRTWQRTQLPTGISRSWSIAVHSITAMVWFTPLKDRSCHNDNAARYIHLSFKIRLWDTSTVNSSLSISSGAAESLSPSRVFHKAFFGYVPHSRRLYHLWKAAASWHWLSFIVLSYICWFGVLVWFGFLHRSLFKPHEILERGKWRFSPQH